MIVSADIADEVSCIPLRLSISTISGSYNSSGGSVCLTVNVALTEFFNNSIDFMPTKYVFFVSKSEIYRIMSMVRNNCIKINFRRRL